MKYDKINSPSGTNQKKAGKPMEKYYTLVVKYEGENFWSIEFGSFDYQEVDEEMDSRYEEDGECRIITTTANQQHIDNKVNELNREIK